MAWEFYRLLQWSTKVTAIILKLPKHIHESRRFAYFIFEVYIMSPSGSVVINVSDTTLVLVRDTAGKVITSSGLSIVTGSTCNT